RVDDDRTHSGLRMAVFYALRGKRRLLVGIHEGQPEGLEFDPFELGKHAVADGFGGDAGTVGNIKYRAAHADSGLGSGCQSMQSPAFRARRMRGSATTRVVAGPTASPGGSGRRRPGALPASASAVGVLPVRHSR